MNRVKNFLLENETYEDGLKRALRCWAVQSERLEQVEAENDRLKDLVREYCPFHETEVEDLIREAQEENNDE